jgi:hypothetical protein
LRKGERQENLAPHLSSLTPSPEPVLVINCAALSPRLLDSHRERASAFHQLAHNGHRAALAPCFPALTCPVQASLTTGALPETHGIIANGFHDRQRLHTSFWEQSDRLVEAERVWTRIRRRTGKPLKSAMLFWQNSMAGDHDVIVTPQPIHKHDGGMIFSCYTCPTELYGRLAAEIGAFPLHKYWGPLAGYESSAWIVRCALCVLREFQPDLTLCYLPQMDYNLQRQGPAGPRIAGDLARLNAGVQELLDYGSAHGMRVLVVSEYGATGVRRAVPLNLALRRAGLLPVRGVKRMDYLDYPMSRAFALVDHQIAHVYCWPEAVGEAEAVLKETAGVEAVVRPGDERVRCGHARAGDLVVIAEADTWFSYPWWEDPARAPDFAREVDIHLKPGYDPCELFKAGFRLKLPPFYVSTDTAQVKGSHGRLPDAPSDGAVLITDLELAGDFKQETLHVTDVAKILEAHFCGDVEERG